MELRHLRTIAAVAQHRSLTKAGEELFLTQSAVSQQIRRLEEELGVTVFRRTSRRVEPTAEGQVILGYAQRVLAEVDGMHRELEELSGLLRGELRIGGVYPTASYDLFGVLAEFRAAHRDVAIRMVEATQDDVLAALRSDEMDCAFAAVDPGKIGDEFAATLLIEEEMVVALPVGHRLCGRRRVTLEELADEDLIAYRDNSALRRRLERSLTELGLEPRNAFHLHRDGGGAGLDLQGPGRRRHAEVGRGDARSTGRAAPDRPEAPHVADRVGLARRTAAVAGGHGVHRARPGSRGAFGRRAAGSVGVAARGARSSVGGVPGSNCAVRKAGPVGAGG